MSIDMVARVFELDVPSAKAKFVMVCLADSADRYGVCYPSIAHISRDTSMPERTVQRVMRWLVGRGFVETFWSFTDKSRARKILHYRLKLEGIADAPRPDYTNCSKELRLEVIGRFEQKCQYCGGEGDEVKGPDGKSWEIDRIIPGSRGGQYIVHNVTLSCKSCNVSKRAKVAPHGTVSLGAILDKQGCQNEESVVPQMAHDPSVKEEPSLEPSFNQLSKQCHKCGEQYLTGKHDCPGKPRKNPRNNHRRVESVVSQGTPTRKWVDFDTERDEHNARVLAAALEKRRAANHRP